MCEWSSLFSRWNKLKRLYRKIEILFPEFSIDERLIFADLANVEIQKFWLIKMANAVKSYHKTFMSGRVLSFEILKPTISFFGFFG